MSVKFPVDPWIVERLQGVNDEVAAGYAGKNSDSLGITQNQFVGCPRIGPWYDMWASKEDMAKDPNCFWKSRPARLNRDFNRISRIASGAKSPPSLPLPHNTLKQWDE